MTIGSLNCSNYEIYIAKSGGSPLVCRLPGTSSIRYKRILNDFSEATIEVALNSSCRDCLSSVNPWEHEVLIFRDSELAWVGPLLSITYRPSDSKVQLYARDLLAWTDKRRIEILNEDYEVEGADIKDVFEWVLNHGYAKGPWNMSWDLTDTGVPIDRFYPGYYSPDRWGGQYPSVGEELRSLSQAGIDFTVVNRHLFGGDLEIQPPSGGGVLHIADKNWAKTPEILINGTAMSTRTIVAGGYGGYYGWYDDQIWIEESDKPWGLLETFTDRSDIDDSYTTELPNAITQESYARHQLLSNPLAYITGGQLAGDSPFSFGDLIPGARIHVGLLESLRDLQTDYRLYDVDVSVTNESENISLTLTLPGVEAVRE